MGSFPRRILSLITKEQDNNSTVCRRGWKEGGGQEGKIPSEPFTTNRKDEVRILTP